jgi:hypothetical protein
MRIHLGIALGILNVRVAEIGCEAEGVEALVDEPEAAGVTQQVRMHVSGERAETRWQSSNRRYALLHLDN